MAAMPVWSRPYPFHCPSWTRSLRVTHELRGRQPQWLCSEFVPFLLLFDCQEAFHCCLVVTCINRINMISIQCHRVGEWWSGKPEFENVSDPAGVYIPFKDFILGFRQSTFLCTTLKCIEKFRIPFIKSGIPASNLGSSEARNPVNFAACYRSSTGGGRLRPPSSLRWVRNYGQPASTVARLMETVVNAIWPNSQLIRR